MSKLHTVDELKLLKESASKFELDNQVLIDSINDFLKETTYSDKPFIERGIEIDKSKHECLLFVLKRNGWDCGITNKEDGDYLYICNPFEFWKK